VKTYFPPPASFWESVYITADTVVISTPLTLKATKVNITARVVVFENDGYIDVTPENAPYNPPNQAAGGTGIQSGSISLAIDQLSVEHSARIKAGHPILF